MRMLAVFIPPASFSFCGMAILRILANFAGMYGIGIPGCDF